MSTPFLVPSLMEGVFPDPDNLILTLCACGVEGWEPRRGKGQGAKTLQLCLGPL